MKIFKKLKHVENIFKSFCSRELKLSILKDAHKLIFFVSGLIIMSACSKKYPHPSQPEELIYRQSYNP